MLVKRNMEEMITPFNDVVSAMDISIKDKMTILGMITAIGYEYQRAADAIEELSAHYCPYAIRNVHDRGDDSLCRVLMREVPTKPRGVKQTNADRIRVMSDEELAEWIYQVQDEDALRKGNFLPPLSKSWWLDWLKQEATE